MRAIDLKNQAMDLAALLKLARQEPLLLITPDGVEFLLSEADDYEQEVAILRESKAFQHFLDQRQSKPPVSSLDELEREIDQELTRK
jgi:hypothetical protein